MGKRRGWECLRHVRSPVAVVVSSTPPTPTEQALNGGFEKYAGTSKAPTSWSSSKFGSTDGKNKIYKSGKFSVQITGSGTLKKTLTQTLTSVPGASGDSVTFSFWVKGSSVPTAGKCMGQVLLYNGPTITTQTLKCPTSTYGFTKKSITFTTTSAYDKIIIRFTYQKSSGSVWFDLVSLVR
jgi:hypothetical protein